MNFPYSLENFDLVKFEGKGSLGQVFRATLKNQGGVPGQPIAIKVIEPSNFYEGTDDGERFLREAEALRRLKHSAIVGFHQSGFTAGENRRPYIAMDFIEGKRLQDAAPSLSPEERVEAIMAVLGGLDHAHSHSVLHRDVKPSNILIRDSDRQSILVDFGQAYLWDGMTTQTLTKFGTGTMGYIPPEVQSNPRDRSVKHDIFSAGVSLYEILVNRIPVFGSYEPISATFPELAGLDPILKKAMAASSERYGSAKEFHADLSGWKARRQVMSTLRSSPRLEILRSRLHSENRVREEAEQKRRSREENIAAQELSHHNVIMAMVERAMRDVVSVGNDAGRNLGVLKGQSQSLPVNAKAKASDHCAIVFEGKNESIILSSWRQISAPFGDPRGSKVLKYPSTPAIRAGVVRARVVNLGTPPPVPKVQFVAPMWTINRRTPASNVLELGRLVCAISTVDADNSNPKLRLFRNNMTALEGVPLPPAEIQTPEEIYEYIVAIISNAI